MASRLKLPVLLELLGRTPARPAADVGPGSGFATHLVMGPGPVVVVDLAEGNLRALRDRAREAGCPSRFLPVVGDLQHLPFRDGSLATILCAEVLEHVAEDRPAAAELVRAMAPGGILVTEVPDGSGGFANWLEWLGVRTVHDAPGPEFHHRRGYTEDGLQELFQGLPVRATAVRRFVGPLAQAVIDAVAAVHLAYQRLRFGRSAWTWSDVHQVTNSPLFRLYRALFPGLLAVARLDARLLRGRFTLAIRFEKEQAP